jgi:hypothetical protein
MLNANTNEIELEFELLKPYAHTMSFDIRKLVTFI